MTHEKLTLPGKPSLTAVAPEPDPLPKLELPGKPSTTRDEERLKSAGWKRRKSGSWKSPYSGLVYSEESAVRVEIMTGKD